MKRMKEICRKYWLLVILGARLSVPALGTRSSALIILAIFYSKIFYQYFTVFFMISPCNFFQFPSLNQL